jgi:hypothetical protein
MCDVCEEPIVYKSTDGVPPVCQFCGAPGDKEVDYNEAIKLRQNKIRAEMAAKQRAADPFMSGGINLGEGQGRRIFVNGVEVDPNELRSRGFNF